jgi:hypothetical protein
MKKAKIKKIVKKSVEEVWNKLHETKVGISGEYSNNLKFSDITEDDKIKIKKMILGLTSKKNQRFDLNISSDRIDFNGETPNSNSYFNITITKGVGIILSLESKKSRLNSNLRYEEVYDELIDDILKIKSDVDSNNFNNIYADIMSEFKILRESNLDDILN